MTDDQYADRAERRASDRAADLAEGRAADQHDDRAGRRAAQLLPEERAAGSADPDAQASAILRESDEREADPEAAPDSFLERRTSAQTVTPGEDTR
jgi:hypothetical protein